MKHAVEIIQNTKVEIIAEERNLHLLDKMRDEPYTSLTNAIDKILPDILKKFELELDQIDHIYCYGTDDIVAEYIPSMDKFKHVDQNDSNLDYYLLNKMNLFYIDNLPF